MKLTVKQENLKNSLNLCSHFISSKNQLPILGNVLIKTSKSKLILSATNLETSVSTSIGAQIEKEGEITIPGKTFVDIISNLSPGQVNLNVNKEIITITSESFKSNISGVNSSDFPKVPSFLSDDVTKIDREKLISSLSKCQFAVSSDETRPILTGVLFIFGKEEKTLSLVSTDGFRLSFAKFDTGKKVETKKIIIPKNVLSEIIKAEGGEAIKFSFDEKDNQVIFGIGNTVFSSRVIEGEFPDFEKIIPTKTNYKLNIDKNELDQAVKLASVFARESGNIIKLIIKNSKLTIKSESSSSGSQETDIDVKIETDEDKIDFEVSYNYKFLQDFLKVVESDNVDIELTTPDKPGKFLDPQNPNFLHLIMPIKVQK